MSQGSLFEPGSIHPLRGVAPHLPDDDLHVLGEIIANARVVGLGEPTHGQKEINQLRDRMTRYLVQHLGFRVIAMEDSAIKCRLVNDFIMHGKRTAQSALRQQNFWTWRTLETLAMVEWLRDWSLAYPNDQVRFIGIDFQDIATPVSELVGVLAFLGPELETAYKPVLARIGAIQMWGEEPFTQADYTYSMKALTEIRTHLETSEVILPESLDLGLDCVLSLQQSLRLRREIAASPHETSANRWNRREEAMVERTLKPTRDGNKVIVWAQNGHVQAEQMYWMPPGAKTLGQMLREHLSDDYIVISGMFGSGGYRGFDQDAGVITTTDVGNPPKGTLDHELWSAVDSPAVIANLDSPGAILFESQTTRWAGAAIERNENMITHVHPARGSNAVAFVRQATPSEPL